MKCNPTLKHEELPPCAQKNLPLVGVLQKKKKLKKRYCFSFKHLKNVTLFC